MTSSRINCRILAEWLYEKFGDNEITEKQYKEELEELFGYADPRIKQAYLERCLRFGQIERIENGKLRATPKHIPTPREKLEQLKNRRK